MRGRRIAAVIPPTICGWTRRPSPVPLSTRRMRRSSCCLRRPPAQGFGSYRPGHGKPPLAPGVCINLIPSEMTPSRRCGCSPPATPAFRYAEHKKIKSFYDADIFYYQGTRFIDQVEQLVTQQMCTTWAAAEAETRVISGQMSNMAVFSALMDWKNRLTGSTPLSVWAT